MTIKQPDQMLLTPRKVFFSVSVLYGFVLIIGHRSEKVDLNYFKGVFNLESRALLCVDDVDDKQKYYNAYQRLINMLTFVLFDFLY